jgi:hypothetical protein
VFEEMGEFPDDANYLKPKGGDVWDFIAKAWLTNPAKKGIPAS